jgi:type II secretory pathway pseudopilin PulG
MDALLKKCSSQEGYSLIEIAIFLLIVGLFIAPNITALQIQYRQQEQLNSWHELKAIHKALRFYAQTHGKMPCPASLTLAKTDPAYGSPAEDCDDGTPPAGVTRIDNGSGEFVLSGAVPVHALGMSRDFLTDPWGNYYYYVVTEDHISLIDLDNEGIINVEDGNSNAITSTASFVVGTHGNSVKGATAQDTAAVQEACDATVLDGENCDFDDALFIDTSVNESPPNPADFYDDYILWATNGSIMQEQASVIYGSLCTADGNSCSASGDCCTGSFCGPSGGEGGACVYDTSSETKVLASDGASNDALGYGLSIYGDKLYAASSADNSGRGSIYIFSYDGTTWSQTQKLSATTGASTQDRLGFGLLGVDSDGQRVIAGASGLHTYTSHEGKAYIFNATTGVEEAVLQASDGHNNNLFGRSVSIDGDRVAVNALWDNQYTYQGGAVYIFDYDGTSWSQTTKLTPPTPKYKQQFGSGIQLDGDRLVVGSYLDDEHGPTDSGSVFVYDYDGSNWNLTQELAPDDPLSYARFGGITRLKGDRLFIAANGGSSRQGAVYVFDYDGSNWSQTVKLVPSDGFTSAYDGFNMDAVDNKVIMGTLSNERAYIFEHDGSSWSQVSTLQASDSASGDRFGNGVALHSGAFLVSARFDDDNGSDSGSLYVFGTPQPGCGGGGGSCTADGDSCTVDGDCCTGSTCNSGTCGVVPSCTADGGSCTVDGDCCTGSTCDAGTCTSGGGGGGGGGNICQQGYNCILNGFEGPDTGAETADDCYLTCANYEETTSYGNVPYDGTPVQANSVNLCTFDCADMDSSCTGGRVSEEGGCSCPSYDCVANGYDGPLALQNSAADCYYTCASHQESTSYGNVTYSGTPTQNNSLDACTFSCTDMEATCDPGQATDESGCSCAPTPNFCPEILSVSRFHGCGIGRNGKAYCWGNNSDGQLGNGTFSDSATPVEVHAGESPGTFIQIGTGYHWSCGLATDNKIYCWGRDTRMTNSTLSGDQPEPTALGVGSSPGTFVQISVGGMFGCGLGTDGRAYQFGLDGGIPMTELKQVDAGEGPGTYKQISAGYSHCCGVGSDDKAYCWGSDSFGKLGDGTTVGPGGAYNPNPVAVHKGAGPDTYLKVDAGGPHHTCALGTDYKAYCWGRNHRAQLGDGGAVSESNVPVAVDDSSSPSTYVDVVAGEFSNGYALASDGTIWEWSSSFPSRQLNGGDGPGLYDHLAISFNGACAIGTDGEAYCEGWESDNRFTGIGSTSKPKKLNTGEGYQAPVVSCTY